MTRLEALLTQWLLLLYEAHCVGVFFNDSNHLSFTYRWNWLFIETWFIRRYTMTTQMSQHYRSIHIIVIVIIIIMIMTFWRIQTVNWSTCAKWWVTFLFSHYYFYSRFPVHHLIALVSRLLLLRHPQVWKESMHRSVRCLSFQSLDTPSSTVCLEQLEEGHQFCIRRC